MTRFDCLWKVTLGSIALAAAAAPCHASVTSFTDYAAWSPAAGSTSTITFGELPPGTLVTDQYAGLGVTFTDPDPNFCGIVSGASDGFALNGFDLIEVTFAAPILSFGWDHPGWTRARFYLGDVLVFNTGYVGNGTWTFNGIVSTMPFDRVQLNDLPSAGGVHDVFVDNMHFSTIPAPHAAAVLGVGAAMLSRRRRRAM